LALAAIPDAREADRMLVVTGNTAKLIRLGQTAQHEFGSAVLNAGVFAKVANTLLRSEFMTGTIT
jgi:hypothetical protein